MTLGAPVGDANDTQLLTYLTDTWRLMYPIAQRLGLIPDDLAEPETPATRLRQEAAANDALIMLPALISAWSHTPAQAQWHHSRNADRALPEMECK